MSATEDLRRELESEWMAQHKILAWPNWLQDQLLKSRQERQAAYSQGYKDALTASATAMDNISENWVNSLPMDTVQSLNCKQYAKAIRSLPIPEAQK